MWNVKTKVIPVIIRATGSTSKQFRKCLSNVSGKYEIKNYKKKQPYWTPYTYFGKY
jgi:hypothetical protein